MTRILTAVLLMTTLAAAIPTSAQETTRTPRARATAPTGAPLDLNLATSEQLEALPGIGAATAKRILEYRQKSGGFKKSEELMNVRGIGEKNFLSLKPFITVTPPRSERAAAQ